MSLSALMTRLAPLAVALALAGCASGVKLDEAGANVPVETRTGSAAGAGAGADAGATSQSQVASVDLSKDQAGANLAKVIYFDFDSFVVRDEYRGLVDQYARVLNTDRRKRLTIEGHTDERGGREYNLALGQKRAEAVQRALALLGVSDGQMESVSFGKERPAVSGSDEAAWSKNRRAELLQK